MNLWINIVWEKRDAKEDFEAYPWCEEAEEREYFVFISITSINHALTYADGTDWVLGTNATADVARQKRQILRLDLGANKFVGIKYLSY